jgi:type IV secretion system protein VirB10
MGALALGILVIIFLTGQPAPAPSKSPTGAAAASPNADRVRDYQDRLRALDEAAAREARAAALTDAAPPPSLDNDSAPSAKVDPLAADRQRRDYESLFASNVALSRRPDPQRPDAGSNRPSVTGSESRSAGAEPTLDDIAQAVVRATGRTTAMDRGAPLAEPAIDAGRQGNGANPPGAPPASVYTVAPNRTGPTHRIYEGTLIDAVLMNRLDGGVAAPVSCLETNAVYAYDGQQVLIPAGARVLGETKPVQAAGETRLAVAFHRILLPDGSSVSLDQFRGLNQIGDSGLKDRVNNHYWSTFGAAGAIGLVGGLAQLIGNAGLGLGDGDRTVIIAGNAGDAAAQATTQVMNRYLNRLPTIAIREGHRVKVYVTSDLDVPEWSPGALFRRE